MLLVKGMPVTVTFCCVQFWITHTACDFQGTHKLLGMCGQRAPGFLELLLSANVCVCVCVCVCVRPRGY